MDTISPVVTEAFNLLHTDLYNHLDEADALALDYRSWTEQDTDSARKLIPDLVIVIRGLLIEHAATPTGNCRICPLPWVLPGRHNDPCAGQGPRPRVRRARAPGTRGGEDHR